MFRFMQQFLEKPENSFEQQPNALEMLPSEIKLHIFSFFQPTQLPVTKLVCREFNGLAKSALREKFKDPKQIIFAIATLEQVFPFIEACQTLEMDFTDPHYTVICKALTTTDITKINIRHLQDAIDMLSEEKELITLLNGLRITKAAIEGNTELVSQRLKNRSDIKVYVNLSGAELTGINLSDVNLDNVNFKKANLMYAELSTAQLERANLDTADLTGTDRYETKCIMQ